MVVSSFRSRRTQFVGCPDLGDSPGYRPPSTGVNSADLTLRCTISASCTRHTLGNTCRPLFRTPPRRFNCNEKKLGPKRHFTYVIEKIAVFRRPTDLHYPRGDDAYFIVPHPRVRLGRAPHALKRVCIAAGLQTVGRNL